MMIPPPPGTPYHRLARTAGHRWWRTVLGTLFIVLGGFLVMVVGYGVYTVAAEIAGRPDGPDGMPGFGPLPDLTLGFLLIAVFLPFALLAARWIQERPAGTLSSVAGRIRWRWLMICLPVAAVAIVVFIAGGTALSVITGGEDAGLDDPLAGWGPFLISMAVLLVVVPFQAAAEEYVCRGWLLQGIGAWLRSPWLPIVVQATVFAALHGWGTPWGFADLVVFGVVTGWLTVRTGGLEAAIALHVMNNLIGSVLSAAFGDLSLDETAADMPWQAVVVDAPVLIGFAAVILWLARRRDLLTATPIIAPLNTHYSDQNGITPVSGISGR
ncbi:CPBP family intramembrane glutamic endopeptidase [Actinoplanes sp. NPDC023801]|uniref:CPBP family intramembrane glutamic endopeptidase n=1 Tax=Actinoplanes sp. NPDC023801 TaxID=3154595 RepID=UPI0033C3CC36